VDQRICWVARYPVIIHEPIDIDGFRQVNDLFRVDFTGTEFDLFSVLRLGDRICDVDDRCPVIVGPDQFYGVRACVRGQSDIKFERNSPV